MLGELSHRMTAITVDLVACPECGTPADIAWRSTVRSTTTGVELAKVHCAARHWFLMPADQLQPI